MFSEAFGHVWTCSDAFGRFQKFSQNFVFIRDFLMFSGVVKRIWVLDMFGHVRMCSDGFGSVPTHSDIFRLRILRSDILKYDFDRIYF